MARTRHPMLQRRMRQKGVHMADKKVFLYALSTCGHCKNTKKLLDAHGVEYDSVDVDLLPRDEMGGVLDDIRKVNPASSFPTLVIDDVVIVGYRETEILEALGL